MLGGPAAALTVGAFSRGTSFATMITLFKETPSEPHISSVGCSEGDELIWGPGTGGQREFDCQGGTMMILQVVLW